MRSLSRLEFISALTLKELRNSTIVSRSILVFISIFLAFIYIYTASAEESVSGTISTNTTWTLANSPYTVTNDITVASGVTLTIEPGVEVKFDAGKKLEIEGTLIARGTSSDKITFTSSAASPAAGDWGYIRFDDDPVGSASVPATFDSNGDYVSGSILEHCIVEYAGSYSSDNNLPVVKNS